MDRKLNSRYLAIQAKYMRLPVQAATTRPRQSPGVPVRRWVGAALILADERMQGAPGSVPVDIGGDHGSAPAQLTK
jgi:hypothetical protein